MKIVYMGSGEFGVPCLDAVVGSRHELGLVVTQPAKSAGRGRKTCGTPVACWAQGRSVVTIESNDVNEQALMERVAEQQLDVLLVIACGQKIGPALVGLPSKAAINVHASLLPKYRGAAPINWVIVNGENKAGVSIITLAQRMDAGEILGQAATAIGSQETAGELHDRLAQMAAPLLLETLAQVEDGSVVYRKQDDAAATPAPKLAKSDGFLDFREPAESLERKIRGFWPWPGASAEYVAQSTGRSTRVTFSMAEVIGGPGRSNWSPGTLDEDLAVVCGRGRVRIRRIKPAGSGLMDFTDFANGRATRPGDAFVTIGS